MYMELVSTQWNNENNLDIFFIIFSLLVVKIYVSFLFWNKNWHGGLTFSNVHLPNFEISTSL